jgi:hypothetical protein
MTPASFRRSHLPTTNGAYLAFDPSDEPPMHALRDAMVEFHPAPLATDEPGAAGP